MPPKRADRVSCHRMRNIRLGGRTESPGDALHGDDAVALVVVALPLGRERLARAAAGVDLERRDVEDHTGAGAPEDGEDERADRRDCRGKTGRQLGCAAWDRE